MASILALLVVAACTPAPSVAPSSPSAHGPLTVAEMLPTTLGGQPLIDHPGVDPTTGALNQLVERVGKTTDDVEAAGRLMPEGASSRASIIGFRITGIAGARLLTEHTAVIGGILEREQGDVAIEAISLGGRDVTRILAPVANEHLYLLASQDALFLIGSATEPEAEDLIRQIP
jgi:hypothetical protein